MSIFKPIDNQQSFPEQEQNILQLWRDRGVFKRSIDARPEGSDYVFFDGPPFATGLPHYGHLVASTIKDIVPRYWTMRGRRVERRFGWDTHGLPIEMEIEKTLGLSGPSSVKAYGVDKFNEACRAGVLKYTSEWRQTIDRLGRWVDFDHDYKTMQPSFMESVWWVFKQLWDKGLVYKDFRVMPYSWRLSTALSNFEANLDYRDVQDPAITVKMPLVDEDACLLIWTTTPWTLPSNQAVAVGEDIDYVKAQKPGDDTIYIVAEARLKAVLGKDAQILSRMKGRDLVGRSYKPLFDYFANLQKPQGNCFVVIPAGHVTTADGTGLVHMAPDFGEDDFNACRAQGIGLLLTVDDEGRFNSKVPDFEGRNVKEADPDLIRAIKAKGRLFKQDTVQHSYPYCWRSGTPLIYKAVSARFVKVTALRDRMMQLNEQIHWVPEAIGQKRFGNWLQDARDWNVSRNRFWGTPIPIWRCEACGAEKCIGSIAELEQLTGAQVTDLHPHKIDHLTMPCSCGGHMKRISDVFDCWFESGSMPYAQNHYPFENKEKVEQNFPAEFIAEGLDQTRGWFYTLLVLSTALFDKPPFKNVVVNGLVLAEDGSKMSKSKRNYPPVNQILDAYGADALRACLLNSPVVRAEPFKFSEKGVKEVVRTVQLPLRNAWSFFVQYANIDGWSPITGLEGQPPVPVAERPDLDRWLLSMLQSLIAEVNREMEGCYLYKVIPPLLGFIDHLTNWYIRRSRRRFWRSADNAEGRRDKACAYATLYEALTCFSKLCAPVLPYLAESIYQSLVVEPGAAEKGLDSVHLCDYPMPDASLIDRDLEASVALTRQVVRMGRTLRERHQLKIRQPLRCVTVILHDAAQRAALERATDQICEELNVERMQLLADDAELATLSFKANFKTLGRKLGKRMKDVAAKIAGFTRAEFDVLQNGGQVMVGEDAITLEDVIVTRSAKGDVVIETDGPMTVALDQSLDPELLRRGLAREIVSQMQRLRKEMGLAVTDRIAVTFQTDDDELRDAIESQQTYISGEILATAYALLEKGATAQPSALDLDSPITVLCQKA